MENPKNSWPFILYNVICTVVALHMHAASRHHAGGYGTNHGNQLGHRTSLLCACMATSEKKLPITTGWQELHATASTQIGWQERPVAANAPAQVELVRTSLEVRRRVSRSSTACSHRRVSLSRCSTACSHERSLRTTPGLNSKLYDVIISRCDGYCCEHAPAASGQCTPQPS